MTSYFHKFQKSAFDYIFPIFCLRCEAEGEWVCAACFPLIGAAGFHACPICHKPNADGGVCQYTPLLSRRGEGEVQCGTQFAPNHSASLSSIRSVTAYKEGALAALLIQTFKYGFVEDCFRIIEKIINEYLLKHRGVWSDIDMIVPVPLHPRRFAERGFNQAERIAASVSQILSLPILSALRRTRYTGMQAHLNKEKRRANVLGAFALTPKIPVSGRRLLLVDDVYTTGSTMHECGRVLSAAGANDVRAFTIARG